MAQQGKLKALLEKEKREFMNQRSTYLFACPSFIEGVARLIDFGGTLEEYNAMPGEIDVDDLMLRLDWQALSEDWVEMESLVHVDE